MTQRVLVAFSAGLLAFSPHFGCERSSSVPAPPAASMATAHAEPNIDSGACAAQRAFERLDARAIVPLPPPMANHQKRNMRDHLLAVEQIVAALASDDFPAVEQAASRLGYSPQMGQMCSHMGIGAAGFSERALAFHHRADGIANAARARDRGAAVKALARTLRDCTSCHEAFQQRVVDDAAFQAQPWQSSGGEPD